MSKCLVIAVPILGLVILPGCATLPSDPNETREGFVWLAVIKDRDGNPDKAILSGTQFRERVLQQFDRQGIEYQIEASGSFMIRVKASEFDRAVEVLDAATTEHKYWDQIIWSNNATGYRKPARVNGGIVY